MTDPPTDGELAEVYERIGARSRVANIIGVHSLHPAALEAHLVNRTARRRPCRRIRPDGTE